jgi:hypothetical protein
MYNKQVTRASGSVGLPSWFSESPRQNVRESLYERLKFGSNRLDSDTQLLFFNLKLITFTSFTR